MTEVLGYPNKTNKNLREKVFIFETEKHPFFPLHFQKATA
jgi:hypothetical protein